jgi:hypothetical protein
MALKKRQSKRVDLVIDKRAEIPTLMGTIPYEESKLDAIHRTVKLLLEHTTRLVEQKERVVMLYTKMQAECAGVMSENDALARALDDSAERAARLTSEVKTLTDDGRRLRAIIARMVHGHGMEIVDAYNALKDAIL